MEQQKIEENMEELEEALMESEDNLQVEEEMSDELVSFDNIELNEDNLLRMVEAILFASSKPISAQAMLERLPEGADLNVLLPKLKERYDGRGVELVEIGGQWALRTAADVGAALTVEKAVQKKMSKAALETMAIVAYHQPITRAEIENIRGVATHKGTLDILMEMGWVKPGRRRESPGRPLTWVTTHDFLDHFQLEALTDLPGLEELQSSGLLDKRAAIETLPNTGDLFDDGDVDAEEVLDSNENQMRDDDAFDEASYKEIKARETAQQNSNEQENEE